ncbi:MAG: hypothetical protein V1722_05315 [Candidatus Micrarchaeota archaeon]
MVGLITLDPIAAVSLVASILVLLYVVGYSVISYYQHKRGQLRSDWKISAIFYAGITLMALAYIFAVVDFCFGTMCMNNFFNIAYLIAILLFVYGLELRTGAIKKIVPEKKRKR